MWARTRDPQACGQNEMMLDADKQCLANWRDWLQRASTKISIAHESTPFCGSWQLQFWVINFAPAVQKVIVEQQQLDGTWRETAIRYTIEFRAKTARPTAKIRREFSVPVDSPKAPLRIAVRGVGQVMISHLALTDGVTTRRAINWSQKTIVGVPAPDRGFPRSDKVAFAQILDVLF